MASDVIMPQMGESIAEGTITKWLKKVGDPVERDEPLFEISTDKVDAEIPSPEDGTLLEILVPEGETVEINTVVARLGSPGEAGSSSTEAPAEAAAAPEPSTLPESSAAPGGAVGRQERIATKSSPVVRRIAAEHGIDLQKVPGTGVHGRVTKKDILAYIESGGAQAPAGTAAAAAGGAVDSEAASAPAGAGPEGTYHCEGGAMLGVSGWPAKVVRSYLSGVAEGDRVEKLSTMRRKIAEHMVISKALSPHVHTLYEVDMGRVDALRRAHKDSFLEAASGAKLTYTVFMVKAVVDALKAFPQVNASIHGDDVIHHRDINVGLAVALEDGLIVPVMRRAQDLSMTGIARAITDLATRARERKLELSEIQGSTFSITNPGSFGGLIGLPVISQPNVAILGMGKVEKRVCVIDDAIAIRPKMYITLGYDHRLIDGAVAEQFLGHIQATLENFDESAL